jgi:hemin uptake protein HemP
MASETVMDDVAKWLVELGLSKYTEVFAKNDVGSDVLLKLTEEHLKELGVSLGDRLRFLEAIDTIVVSQAEDNKALAPSDTASNVAITPGEAERRQLTVVVSQAEDNKALAPSDAASHVAITPGEAERRQLWCSGLFRLPAGAWQ